MKKVILGIVLSSLVINLFPGTIMANQKELIEVEKGVYFVPSEQISDTKSTKSYLASEESSQEFVAKTEEERNLLSIEEQELVDKLENYLNQQVNLNQRGFIEPAIEEAIVELAFDIGFNRESDIFKNIAGIIIGDGTTENPNMAWFQKLKNVSERSIQVYDEPTKSSVILKATYIDNGSSETVIVHHGYRGSGIGMMNFIKLFSDRGYNVLFPDARSHHNSGGKYISFGHYEKTDLNKWIDQEAKFHPNQEVILFGLSMGAATTMLSQEVPHPNVKAYIEDCGYATADQQLKDTWGIVANYLQYIPVINAIDWYAKTDSLIYQINEQKVKPILKFDLYAVSPQESVARTGIPKLFIHGDADWFIPPVAMKKLYNNAIGYKEQLSIPNAGHGEAMAVGGKIYSDTIFAFLDTVAGMTTKPPVVAEDVNLLKNSTFGSSNTNFDDWETGTIFKNSGFSRNSLKRNSYSEFVLKDMPGLDLVTAVKFGEGIRFYTKGNDNEGFVGQSVKVTAGESYKLSFNAKTGPQTGSWSTYSSVLYGIDDIKKEDTLKSTNMQAKSLNYVATETKEIKVKLGGKLGYRSFLDIYYAETMISDITLVNSDRTPPKALSISNISWSQGMCVAQGKGEPNSIVLVENQAGEKVADTKVDAKGNFSINLGKDQGTVRHLMNQDVKGNKSESTVVIIQK